MTLGAPTAIANDPELAYVPTNAFRLNRIEAQFTALSFFALDGTDHSSHGEQASMIRRYIIWRTKRSRPAATRNREQGKCCLTRHQ